MKTKLILAATAAVLLSSSPSWAECKYGKDHMKHNEKMMEKMDKDGDGVVSKSEFMQKHEDHFTKVDSDGDGNLSSDEMKAAWNKKREKMKEKRAEMEDKHEGMEDMREEK